MNYKSWLLYYYKIIDDFGYDEKKDIESARILDELLKTKKLLPLEKLYELISNKNVYVYSGIKYKPYSGITVACNSSIQFFSKTNVPNLVVTDLDGDVEKIIELNNYGSIVVIHAHGDNINLIKKYVSLFSGTIIGTTQNNPSLFKYLHNFYGFTDGDRAIYMAYKCNANKIYLVGFDFKTVKKYSVNKEIKLKKLSWCKKLISLLPKNKICYV